MFSITKHGVPYTFLETGLVKTDTWVRENFAHWEPFTFEVFERVASPTKLALDIGAWIGLTAIWLSKHFKDVLAVEADPQSVKSLAKNLAASECSNVAIIPQPLFNRRTRLYFGPNAYIQNATLNDSMSQLKERWTHPQDITMETVTLTQIIENPAEFGFIKCDIEGGEEAIVEELLTFCETHKTPLLLSFHIWWWKDASVRRFSHLFEKTTAKIFSEGFHEESDPLAYLEANPMGTLFFSY